MAEEVEAIIIVDLKFSCEADLEEIAAAFAPLAAHVTKEEEGALAYEWAVSTTDPLKAVIVERYVSRSYIEAVHMQSAPFKAFFAAYMADDAPWRQEHALEMAMNIYKRKYIGHMDRP